MKEQLNHNLEDKRKLNMSATNIGSTFITLYILILSLIEYVRYGKFAYNIFSIFFIGELAKACYKYTKSKDNLYLLESIGCVIAIIGLFILMK